MKFFIIGDSWGVGEYKMVSGMHEAIPNTGLDYYLTQLGHTVINTSAGSAGNFGQLRNAYWLLKENSDFDYIIWFHVEPVRDIYETVINDTIDGPIQYPNIDKKKFINCMNYVHNQNYIFAQKIYDEFSIPFIVVGCSGLVIDDISNFSFSKHIIKSWAQELLNVNHDMPLNCGLLWLNSVLAYYPGWDRRQMLNELDLCLRIREKMSSLVETFPDEGHPSRNCFKQLAQRLVDLLENE